MVGMQERSDSDRWLEGALQSARPHSHGHGQHKRSGNWPILGELIPGAGSGNARTRGGTSRVSKAPRGFSCATPGSPPPRHPSLPLLTASYLQSGFTAPRGPTLPSEAPCRVSEAHFKTININAITKVH